MKWELKVSNLPEKFIKCALFKKKLFSSDRISGKSKTRYAVERGSIFVAAVILSCGYTC